MRVQARARAAVAGGARNPLARRAHAAAHRGSPRGILRSGSAWPRVGTPATRRMGGRLSACASVGARNRLQAKSVSHPGKFVDLFNLYATY